MYPELLDLGKVQIHSYGLMMFLGIASGLWLAYRRGKQAGLGENVVIDLATWMIVMGLIGARTFYVVTHLDEFQGNWLGIINPVRPDGTLGLAGLVFLGSVVFAVATLIFIAWRRKLNLLVLMDVFAPALALGSVFGRIGCFLNGCCFGMPTDLPWGVEFPPGSYAGSVFHHVHVHPTQLYDSLYNLALVFGLLWAERRFRTFPGFTASLFLIGYGALRFLIEMIRYYESSMYVIEGVLTVSQTISAVMVIAGIVLLIVLRRRAVGTIATQ